MIDMYHRRGMIAVANEKYLSKFYNGTQQQIPIVIHECAEKRSGRHPRKKIQVESLHPRQLMKEQSLITSKYRRLDALAQCVYSTVDHQSPFNTI